MAFCLFLGTLLGIISLVLGVQWCRRGACRGSGMMRNLPSEGIYEDIGAVPMGEKEGLSESRDLVLEGDYDDVQEPECDPEEQEEPEEGTPLSLAVCATVCIVLVLLYCSYVQQSALASSYI